MKDYAKDFDEKLQDESFSDNELLSIARDYISEMQELLMKTQSAIESSVRLINSVL